MSLPLPTGTIPKSWGYERIIHNGTYCCKELVYTKRVSSSLHYHPVKDETFYVHSGRFLVLIPGETKAMSAGDHLVIPHNTPHRVTCLEEGTIVESSSHDDRLDCVRLLPSDT